VANCDDVIPIAEVNDAVNGEAVASTKNYTSGPDEDGSVGLCSWSPDGFGGQRFGVSVRNALWSPYTGDNYMLDGNSANVSTVVDSCVASVAVGDDRAIEVLVMYLDNNCEVAKDLLEIAFERLAKA
jgi:hypothetical protein